MEATVTSNGSNSYAGSVTIPSTVTINGTTYSVTGIGQSAFYGCERLSMVIIPNSVNSIGGFAFYNCSGLRRVTIDSRTPLGINANTFKNCTNVTLCVPYGYKSTYQNAAFWGDFKEIVENGEVIDNFYSSSIVLTANSNNNNADDYILLSWDIIQEKLNDIKNGEGLSPRGWNTYEVVEDEQYVYDPTTNKLVLIDKIYSNDFPYFSFGKLEVIHRDIDYYGSVWVNELKWSFSTNDYRYLYYDLKSRIGGINKTTGATKVPVMRYYRLHSPDAYNPDLYIGLTIPAGKLVFPSECTNQSSYGMNPASIYSGGSGIVEDFEYATRDWKPLRLQALLADIDEFSTTMGEAISSISNGKELLSAHSQILQNAENRLGTLVSDLRSSGNELKKSVDKGHNILWADIEDVENNWGKAKSCINDALGKMSENLCELHVICNGEGRLNMGRENDYSVITGTKTVYGFSSAAFCTDWSPVSFSSCSPASVWNTIISSIESDELTISVVPDEGYQVKTFTVNDIEQASNSINLTIGSGDIEIVMEFEENDATRTEKTERLQSIIDACYFKSHDDFPNFAIFTNYENYFTPTQRFIDSFYKFYYEVIGRTWSVARDYKDAIEEGANVSFTEIEALETGWQNASRCLNLSIESIFNNRHSFTLTCNKGGKIGDVADGTKTYIVSCPQFVDWSSVDNYLSEVWNYICAESKGPIHIDVIPDDGFRVKNFTVNGVEQTSNSIEYTIENEDVAIVAEFESIYDDNNVLEIADASVIQGGTVTVPISMTNEDDITAFQFELQLPEGFSVQDAVLTSRKSNQTMGYSLLENGNYRFTAFSPDAQAFSGSEGALVNVLLKAGGTMTPGDYIIKVKNIELTTTSEEACKPANCSATVTVGNIKVGDANGDGNISITDAVAVVNYLLNRPSTSFRADAADLTGDGNITITDAVAIVNIVLGKRPANARMREPQ